MQRDEARHVCVYFSLCECVCVCVCVYTHTHTHIAVIFVCMLAYYICMHTYIKFLQESWKDAIRKTADLEETLRKLTSAPHKSV